MEDSWLTWLKLTTLHLTSTSMAILPFVWLLLLPPPFVHPLSFDFPYFSDQNQTVIALNGDASFGSSNAPGIQLTRSTSLESQSFSVGRAVHKVPLLLWDSTSGNVTDFVTHFSFLIKNSSGTNRTGDGLAFFLAPHPAYNITVDNCRGESLGLFNSSMASPVVAAEFDTYRNNFDPMGDHLGEEVRSVHHVGIDVLSKKSRAYTVLNGFTMVRNDTAHAIVSYNARTMNLSVFLYYDPSVTNRSWSTSACVDLRGYLPEMVSVGFSASTGTAFEMHTITSWNFSSTLQSKTLMIPKKNLRRLFLDVSLGVPTFLSGIGLSLFVICWRRIRQEEDEEELLSVDSPGMRLKSFQYEELVSATRNFARERKLGEGGFGSVYYGVLGAFNHHPEVEVAIKRISRESMQGRKEYFSEITVISRLRHRNLVQLIGYCHEKGEFLLVYQCVPNGSLNSHLYNRETLLRWPERYKIAVGLASALFYLHEEWEQCVVHRDLKPSNVMLDVDFTPKLGDFGLARLVDHGNGAMITALAGTRGYMAPEYEETGKASKESDVYAFGVVALEVACGRRPIDFTYVAGKISLVGWVRDLYDKGNCLAAVDRRLREEFDKRQMKRLMGVALWCAHPDYKLRPSIRRVVGVLNYDAPLPELPQLTQAFADNVSNDCTYSSTSTSGTG